MAPADPAVLDPAVRVAQVDRVAQVGPVSRADRAMDLAATGREVTSPVVPEGTSRVAPADTSRAVPEGTALEARVDLRGNLVSLGARAVRASPVVPAGTIRADPAVTIPVARGRMVQVLRAQGLRGRAAPVLNPGRVLLDLTPTVPDQAHLDRTPAVPGPRPEHPDRMRPAGLTRQADRRWVATARAAMPRPAPIRPADRTPQEGATPRVGATHPVEVTDLRPKLLLVTVAVIPRPLPFRVLASAE